MKKIDLGQTITILANIGVIAGIAFLAVDLRQNNELMRAAARDAQNARIQEYVEQVYMVPGLAEIILKARSETPLTEVEQFKLLSRQGRRLRGMEAQWREYVEGTVEIIPSGWKSIFYEGDYYNLPLIGSWNEIKPTLRVGFVEYIEQNIVNER